MLTNSIASQGTFGNSVTLQIICDTPDKPQVS